MSLIEEKGKYGLEDEQSSWLAGMVLYVAFFHEESHTNTSSIPFKAALVLELWVTSCYSLVKGS